MKILTYATLSWCGAAAWCWSQPDFVDEQTCVRVTSDLHSWHLLHETSRNSYPIVTLASLYAYWKTALTGILPCAVLWKMFEFLFHQFLPSCLYVSLLFTWDKAIVWQTDVWRVIDNHLWVFTTDWLSHDHVCEASIKLGSSFVKRRLLNDFICEWMNNSYFSGQSLFFFFPIVSKE